MKKKLTLDFREKPNEKERILRSLRKKREKEMQKKLMKRRKEEIELARLKYQKMEEISNKIKSVNLPTTFFSLAPDAKEKEEERL